MRKELISDRELRDIGSSLRQLHELVNDGSALADCADSAEEILDGPMRKLFRKGWKKSWKERNKTIYTSELDEAFSRDGWKAPMHRGLFLKAMKSLAHLALDRTPNRKRQCGWDVEALLNEFSWPEGPHSMKTDDQEKGISLYDLAFVIEGDEQVAKELVKQWGNSKKITAKPIGKCPLDGRKQLYRLSEILLDVKNILSLNRRELRKYRKALTAQIRTPKRK